MEKEMKELYGEGLATHTDPESCAGSQQGAGEALTGAHAGRDIEPRKQLLLGADVVTIGGRQHEPARDCERGSAQRGPRTRGPGWDGRGCMRGISMRENREIP
jgi:hypothetical protein